ncbi:MAG: energy transducer TonB [Rhodothermia bacterium]|nr:energy transducer TonB [Rhodothermia bacterium]
MRRTARLDSYRTRMMLSLATSLALTIVVLRVPLLPEPDRVGWASQQHAPLLELSQSSTSAATRHEDGSVESFGVPDARVLPTDDGSKRNGAPREEDVASSNLQKMRAREAVYEFVDSPPEIRGGLGAYYIRIEYPEEAVLKGIEGRLMLRFVVDTEGRPTDIRVLKSLHPLCDSAAVRALRATTFVAGSQNGKKVPVRMHLPVRFRLVEAGTLSRPRDTLGVRLTE